MSSSSLSHTPPLPPPDLIRLLTRLTELRSLGHTSQSSPTYRLLLHILGHSYHRDHLSLGHSSDVPSRALSSSGDRKQTISSFCRRVVDLEERSGTDEKTSLQALFEKKKEFENRVQSGAGGGGGGGAEEKKPLFTAAQVDQLGAQIEFYERVCEGLSGSSGRSPGSRARARARTRTRTRTRTPARRRRRRRGRRRESEPETEVVDEEDEEFDSEEEGESESESELELELQSESESETATEFGFGAQVRVPYGLVSRIRSRCQPQPPTENSVSVSDRDVRMNEYLIRTRRKLARGQQGSSPSASAPGSPFDPAIELALAQEDIAETQVRLRSDLVDSMSGETRMRRRIGSGLGTVAGTIGRKKAKRVIVDRSEILRRDLLDSRKRFAEFRMNKRRLLGGINKDLVAHFDQLERRRRAIELRKHYEENREPTETEVERRKRLKALREQDEQRYFKLLERAKERKILELLKQTDVVLRKLGAQLRVRATEGSNEDQIVNETSGTLYEQHLRNKESYYQLAHHTQEDITQQPPSVVGGLLRSYQITGLKWLVSLYNNNINGILADEMGLGKTIQTIALFAYLMEKKGNSGPHLVIAPLNTIFNWMQEFKKWTPHITAVRYGGVRAERRRIDAEVIRSRRFHVLLTHYDIALRDTNVLKKVRWNYVVVDEGQRLKNRKSRLVIVLKQYHMERRLLLTGTPVQNNLSELWSLLNFILPWVFDSSDDFEKWFSSAAPVRSSGRNSKLLDALTEEERLLVINRMHQVLRPFLLRREVCEVEQQLPKKQEYVIRCELSALQEKYYMEVQRKKRIIRRDGDFLVQEGLANIHVHLRKVCNHPYLFHKPPFEKNEDLVRSCGKLVMLDNMLPKLRATGHRVLIFSQMTQLLNILEVYLQYRGFSYFRLDGSTKVADRDVMIQDFARPDSRFIFLLSTRSGGLGINLQSADTVIIYDKDWNPQQDVQAQARAWRIGQTQEVRVFTMLTMTPLEERLYETAELKRQAEMQIVKAGRYNTKSNLREREVLLREIMKMDLANFHRQFRVPTHAKMNEMLARTPSEKRLFRQMDIDREQSAIDFYKKAGLNRPQFQLLDDSELPFWLRSEELAHSLLDESEKFKKSRRRKRSTRVTSYSETTEEEFFAAATAKKRGRSRRSSDIDELQPPLKRLRHQDVQRSVLVIPRRLDTLDPRSLQSPLQLALFGVFQKLVNLLDELDPIGNRLLALPFMDVPEDPQYSSIVPIPMSFRMIEQKIAENAYSHSREFEHDVKLIAENCRAYFGDSSPVFRDVGRILNELAALRNLLPKSEVEE